jgi:hypothetical protein
MIDWTTNAQRLVAAIAVIFATMVAWWDVERWPSRAICGRRWRVRGRAPRLRFRRFRLLNGKADTP